MTFAEADAQYEIARQRYLAGALTDEQYDDQLRDLMVSDDQGRWWAKSRENGNWHYYDTAADSWIAGTPPVEPPPLRPQPAQRPTAQPLRQAPDPATPIGGLPPAASGSQAGVPKWAAVVPAAHAPAAPSASKTAQSAGPAAPPAAGYSAADFRPLPELSGAVKLIFAVLSFFVPVLGILLFLIYRGKPAQADRAAARLFLILGVASLALTCLSVTLLGVAGSAIWDIGG